MRNILITLLLAASDYINTVKHFIEKMVQLK